MRRTPSAGSSRATRGVGTGRPCNRQNPTPITPMSGTGSSSLINRTSSGPHCPVANASGGLQGGSANASVPNTLITDSKSAPSGGAGSAQFPISPPSISSNPVLVGSSNARQERKGQQNQAGPARPENDNLLNRRKVEQSRNNYFQPQVSGGAGPAQFLTSPPSCSSNPELVGSYNVHLEQQGQQGQAGPALSEKDNELKRQKVELNQNNYFQPQILDSSQNQQSQAVSNPQQIPTHHHPQMHQNARQLPQPIVKPPFVKGICARRLMQYMDDQRSRPAENSINYWMQFVNHYYSPRAKIMWCLSSYGNIGKCTHGIFPQTDAGALPCDLCHSRSGKGFEVKVEALPKLDQIKFDHGLIDELLFLDAPNEIQLGSGLMILECKKTVQESVYEKLRVVHSGRLRVSFTPELKILNWEFCVQRHEVFLHQGSVIPQVSQLMRVAQKYQACVAKSGSFGVSHEDLEACCNMFSSTSRQLAKSLELQSLNEWGFSKRYVRCLQISQVANSLKELIDFSREHNMGPIESLKNYPQHATIQPQKTQLQQPMVAQSKHSVDQNKPQPAAAMFQPQMTQLQQPMAAQSMHSMDQNSPQHIAAAFQPQMTQSEQPMAAQSLHPMDQNNHSKMIAAQQGTRHYNLSNNRTGTAALNNSGFSVAATLNSCQNLIRSSGSPNQTPLQFDRSCNYINPNLAHPSALANNSVNSLSLLQQNNQQCSEDADEKVIQMMLQEFQNNKEEVQQQASRAISTVVAPDEVFNSGGGGGVQGLPVLTNAELIRNETNVDPLAVNSSNSNAVDSEPGMSNNFPADIDKYFNMDSPEFDNVF